MAGSRVEDGKIQDEPEHVATECKKQLNNYEDTSKGYRTIKQALLNGKI